jgi:hypothetical protein
MRIVTAAIVGGIVLFLWGFVANMLLPLGMMGHERPVAEDPVLEALAANMSQEGVYMLPGLAPEQYEDEAALAAYGEKSARSPYAFVIYQPQGRNGLDMVKPLAIQLASTIVASGMLAWVLVLVAGGFFRKVAVATVMGGFAWVVVALPWWNWYRFPAEFVAGSLVQQVVGWFLAGLAIAWILGRGRRGYH